MYLTIEHADVGVDMLGLDPPIHAPGVGAVPREGELVKIDGEVYFVKEVTHDYDENNIVVKINSP